MISIFNEWRFVMPCPSNSYLAESKGNNERKNYDNLWPDNQIESRTVTSIHILCWSIIFLSFSWYWVRMRGCGSWTLNTEHNVEHYGYDFMTSFDCVSSVFGMIIFSSKKGKMDATWLNQGMHQPLTISSLICSLHPPSFLCQGDLPL